MQVDDVARQLGGQNQRLPEAADAVAGRIAPQIAPPRGAGSTVPRQPARTAPRTPDAQRLVVEVLGQVGDGRTDFGVDRVRLAVGRMAQRKEREADAALLERVQLLRDEGLRQARIPLEDHADDAGRARTIHPGTVSLHARGRGAVVHTSPTPPLAARAADVNIESNASTAAAVRLRRPHDDRDEIKNENENEPPEPARAWNGPFFATSSTTPGATRSCCWW